MRQKTKREAVFHSLGNLEVILKNNNRFGLQNYSKDLLKYSNNSNFDPAEAADEAIRRGAKYKVGDIVYVPITDYVSRQYHGLGLVLWDSRKKSKFLHFVDEGHMNIPTDRISKNDLSKIVSETDYTGILYQLSPLEFQALFLPSAFHFQMFSGFGTNRKVYRFFF